MFDFDSLIKFVIIFFLLSYITDFDPIVVAIGLNGVLMNIFSNIPIKYEKFKIIKFVKYLPLRIFCYPLLFGFSGAIAGAIFAIPNALSKLIFGVGFFELEEILMYIVLPVAVLIFIYVVVKIEREYFIDNEERNILDRFRY